MTEAEWLTCTEPVRMLQAPVDRKAFTERRVRLFYAACCRSIWDWMTDSRLRKLVEVAEEVHDGLGSPNRLVKAHRRTTQVARHLRFTARQNHVRLDAVTSRDSATSPERLAQAVVRLFDPADVWAGVEDLGVLAHQTGDYAGESTEQCAYLRDIVGPLPFRPVALDPRWRTADVLGIARQLYDSRVYSPMPILADALMDAGCADEQVLDHCREPGLHVRGCWVLDIVLGKE